MAELQLDPGVDQLERLVGDRVVEVKLGLDAALREDRAFEDDARGALKAREELASTGVGMNVAIPHVKLEGLEEAIFSLSVAPDGLEWQAVDGAPVQIVFVVLRPDVETEEYDPERHLEMMRWIARLARNEDFRRFAIGSKNRTELVDLLKEMSAV